MNKQIKLDTFTFPFDSNQLFNLGQDLLMIMEPNFTIKWVNRSWYKLLGYNEDQLTGLGLKSIVHPDDLNFFKIRSLTGSEPYAEIKMRFRSADGFYRWISWSSSFNAEENLIYVSARDITSRILAEGETKLLHLLAKTFTDQKNIRDLLEFALGEICKLFRWPYGELWKIEGYTNSITCSASWYEHSPELKKFNKKSTATIFKKGKGIIGKSWVDRHIGCINLPGNEKENLRLSWMNDAGFTTVITVPVKLNKSQITGVLAFYLSGTVKLNSEEEMFLENIANQLCIYLEQAKIEEKLQNNQKILEETQKITHTGSWEWNIPNNRIYWTQELFNIYGIEPRKEMDLETVLNFLLAGDKEIMNQHISYAIHDTKPFSFEHKVYRPDGSVRIVHERGEVILDQHGNASKIIGTVHDITSFINSEERLKKSEEYFRSLIENAIDIKSILNSEGFFLYISPSIEKSLGYRTTDLIGRNIIKYIHPEDVSRLIRVFARVLKKPDSTSSVEFRIKDKQGKWRSMESIMRNLLHNPSVGGVVVNSRDITMRKEAEITIHTLLSISKRLNSTLNVDLLMDALVEEAIKLTGSEGGYTGLRTAEGMVCKKYFLESTSVDFEFCWPPDVGIPGRLIISGKTSVIVNNAAEDPNMVSEIREKFSIKAAAYVSILNSHGDIMGFLSVTNKKSDTGYTDSDKEKLIALSQSASTAIQNALAYQKIQAAEFQLKNSREQLRRLSAHTQSAREEERTRISREIHDELGQALTGLKMDLSWMEKRLNEDNYINQPVQEKITAMYSLINSTIKSVRKISSELRPGVLDYLGLAAAIEWQAQEFQGRTGIKCEIISLPKELELDQNFSTALFRIFQETLTNVARHAQATRVRISLQFINGNVILTIHDNGRGITEEEIINTKSFGLLGMRERAYLLGGEFNIKPHPEGGTIVTVNIPIGNINEKGEVRS